jgi:protein arginine kinase
MNLLSGVRLGLGLKLLPGLRVYTLNQIMIFTQSAHLEKLAETPLSEGDADSFRARYIRRLLEREGVPDNDDDDVTQ